MAKEYGLKSERGVALMTDVNVQNGSIKTATKNKILASFKENMSEVEKMIIISTLRSKDCNPQWQADVLKRKLMYANGIGTVHGIIFDLAKDYAIDLQDA